MQRKRIYFYVNLIAEVNSYARTDYPKLLGLL